MYLENKKIGAHPNNQQGFVLILVLVLLTMMTLIGVSSMNSSSIELKAAANAQQHQVAFNAVQSLLEYTISDQGAAPVVDYQISDPNLTQIVTTTLANAASLSATVVLSGCSIGLGSSLEAGKGFSYNFFTIRGSGSNTQGGSTTPGKATSIQGQGIRYPSASC